MHVAISILPDQLLTAEKLLERIAELGGVSQYPCILVTIGEVDVAKCQRLAASVFQGVGVFPVELPHNHPTPSNVLFARTALHMGVTVGDAYLYLEPNAWPTSPHWLNDLVNSYREHNHRFMGKLEPLPDNPSEFYMLPTAIYPKDFWAGSDLISQIPFDKPASQFLYGEIVYRGKAYNSSLFATEFDDSRNAALVIPSAGLKQIITEAENDFAAGRSLDSLPEPTTAVDLYAQTMAEQYPEGAPAPTYVPETFQPSPEYAEMVGAKMAPVHETAQWVNDPRALDTQIPVAVATIPPAMEEPGTLDSYPSVGAAGNPVTVETTAALPSQEGFATVEQRNAAIKRDHAAGMKWRELLREYRLTPSQMKQVLNAN